MAPRDQTIEPREPRIELDDNLRLGDVIFADDQADDGRRLVHRFPVYVQHLLARRIERYHSNLGVTIDDLDDWTDDELADFADRFAALDRDGSDTSKRKIAYLRILAVALRHFGNDPAAVRGSIVLVGMIAKPRPRLGAGPSELDE